MDYVSLVCCALAFGLYCNTLDSEFVYDDRRAILTNPDLLPDTPWTRILQNDFWGTALSDSGSHGSYRPLCVLTFRLNYLLGGYQPWGYHLVNVLLHCSATYLFIRIAKLILPTDKSEIGSAVSGLLFACHPIHTESVAGIVGRADLAACNFNFLSLLAYISHVKLRDSTQAVGKVKSRKYERIAASLQKSVSSCNWPKRNIRSGRREKDAPKTVNISQLEIFNLGCWSYDLKMWMYLIVSIGWGLAAMLSKETGITALGICFVYDCIFSKSQTKRKAKSLAVLLIALILTLLMRLQTRTPKFSTADNPTARESNLLTRTLTFVYLPVFNFWLLIFPDTLSFDWGMDAIPRITSLTDERNFISLCFYSILIDLAVRCARGIAPDTDYNKTNKSSQRKLDRRSNSCNVCNTKGMDLHTQNCRSTNNNNNITHVHMCVCAEHEMPRKSKRERAYKAVLLFSIACLVLPFLPATNLLFYVGFVVAERVLYIPSAGLCLLVGLVGGTVWKNRKYRVLFSMAFVLVLIGFSAKTILRNRDWYDEEALYRSAIPVNPSKAYGNLGAVLSSQGRVKEAEWALRKALQFRPNMADVYYNLGILLQGKQQLDEAIFCYKRAIYFRPSLALAYVNLGTALIAAGRCEEAIDILNQGSRLDGSGLKDRKEHEYAKVSALLQLGALYADQGHLNMSLAIYKEAAFNLPKHYPPQAVFNVLGETLAKLHQDEEAEKWYRAALKAAPNHIPAHITYGKLLAKNVSRLSEAEQWFRKAQRLAPKDISVYHHYGEFLVSNKRYKEAASMYEKAAELRPDDFQLAVTAAIAMRKAGRHKAAEKWYRKAVVLRPTDARSHTNLGAILHLNGKYEEAAERYREALRLEPNDAITLTNLHRLYGLMT